mgnify:CR=1 FL=1|tara:strand:+ start:10222 stop:11781 length:1560 start_codon:yes stop_codon:yes gene_type:complete
MKWKLILLTSAIALTITVTITSYFSGCCNKKIIFVEQVKQNTSQLLLTNVTVVDTYDGHLRKGMNIFISNGMIVSVSADLPVLGADLSDIEIVDAQEQFAVPGYLDMHAHVLENADPGPSLALMLANGITGFRQMSGSYNLLKRRENNKLPIPLGAPSLLQMPGPLMIPTNAAQPVQAIAELHKQKAAGADFIKVGFVNSEVLFALLEVGKEHNIPIVGHVPASVDMLQASNLSIHSIEHMGPIPGLLMNCSTNGQLLRHPGKVLPKLVTSMLPYIPFIDQLVSFLGEETIINPMLLSSKKDIEQLKELMNSYEDRLCRQTANVLKNNGTWMVPTMIRSKTSRLAFEAPFNSEPNLRYMPSKTIEKWKKVTADYVERLSESDKDLLRKNHKLHLHMVKILDEQAVNLLTGSDSDGAGWIVPGFGLHQEFDELGKAGLSPLRILQMTTLNGAHYLGKTATMGSIAAGKIADLVLLKGDPTQDVSNLHKIDSVIKSGHYFSRADLDSLLHQVKSNELVNIK